jgi:threonine aldolase
VGILAAAADYALDHNVERLAEDHAHARRLAEAIAVLPGIRLNPRDVETNIVLFEVDGPAAEFVGQMHEQGVWMFATGPRQVRALTHLDVSGAQIDRAIEVFRQVCHKQR